MTKKYLVTDDELRAKVLAILRDVDTNQVGTIISFMGQQPPNMYLRCDGGQHLIDEYQELADFIVVNFGAVNYFGGDGERYFAVPNLSGEFLRGSGENEHESQGNGADVGVHQNGTEIPTITVYSVSASTTGTGAFGCNFLPDGASNSRMQADSFIVGHQRVFGDVTVNKSILQGSFAYRYTSRPTNTSVLFCIKAKMW